MKVSQLVNRLGLKTFTGDTALDREVTGVYTCDLLSWVMSHAAKDSVWITVHTHVNIVAVAVLTELPCIILPENICAEEATVQRACQEGIAILGSEMDTYELCWRLHEIL